VLAHCVGCDRQKKQLETFKETLLEDTLEKIPPELVEGKAQEIGFIPKKIQLVPMEVGS